MVLKGYFIQYKFILPENIKHSSYTYQKLFRAIYGYSQLVSKSNGKTYTYHRPGILSKTPYIRSGKNCVIIPQNSFQELANFFKTGKNPGHTWTEVGDWKAVYYLNEKDLNEKMIIPALEKLLDRTYILSSDKERTTLYDEMDRLVSLRSKGEKIKEDYKRYLLDKAQPIIEHEWFKQTYKKSPKLRLFFSLYNSLK